MSSPIVILELNAGIRQHKIKRLQIFCISNWKYNMKTVASTLPKLSNVCMHAYISMLQMWRT